MNAADLLRDVIRVPPLAADTLLAAVRAVAQGPLQQQVQGIDQEGHYPRAVLQQLAQLGAMSAHLDAPAGPGSYGLAIQAMAEKPRRQALQQGHLSQGQKIGGQIGAVAGGGIGTLIEQRAMGLRCRATTFPISRYFSS